MKLYMAASTDHARRIIEHGFDGVSRQIAADDGTLSVHKCVMMRDRRPTGMIFDRITGVETVVANDGTVRTNVRYGWSMLDEPRDFVMVVEVPNDEVAQYEMREDRSNGLPFREYWMPPEFVNAYRRTLIVLDSRDGSEVRADRVGR